MKNKMGEARRTYGGEVHIEFR